MGGNKPLPGNELDVCRFLLSNIGQITLDHIGVVETIGAPSIGPGVIEINGIEEINQIRPDDSRKKADIYINGKGVSIKQIGSSFSYNRLQRANLIDIYSYLNFNNIDQKLDQIDNEVKRFHDGLLDRRNRRWQEFFSERDFSSLLEFLMMKGSGNYWLSEHPAEFILEAPAYNISLNGISFYTFEEYFEKYKDNFKIAIRRGWIGQASNSEHKRAVGLANKQGNRPWVFDSVSGTPRSGWRNDFTPEQRRTVYYLMIEKEGPNV